MPNDRDGIISPQELKARVRAAVERIRRNFMEVVEADQRRRELSQPLNEIDGK